MKRHRWIIIAFLGTCLLVYGGSRLGNWILVQDPLTHADAIVVFGGQMPFRAMEAASIYKQGMANEVWLTRSESPETQAAEKLDIGHIPEYMFSVRVLERLGVPNQAIHVIEPPCVNTTDEVRTAALNLQKRGGRRVILVSSKYHTRRIRETWRKICRDGQEAVVRYTSADPFQPDRWWANSRDVLAVMREAGGILNVWAGFPLNAARP